MQHKALVFGANGQLGRELMRQAGDAATGLGHIDADIADKAAVERAVAKHVPSAIVNAAGYTAVDQAESDSAAAFRVNCNGAGVLAEVAASSNIPLIHVSTDYVFDGTKRTPYREDDPVAPLNVYGRSKEAGERSVREAHPRHVILRTSWVYSPHGANFVRTMLRLGGERPELRIVDDQTGCPTSAADLAGAILWILAASRAPRFDDWGTYHYCGQDTVTWFDFAQLIFDEAARHGRKTPRLMPTTTAAFAAKATRPAYSVLSPEKLTSTFGIGPRPLRDSLRECLGVLLGSEAAGSR
jgi:dTDP-4-dehydrorhamnose reductase